MVHDDPDIQDVDCGDGVTISHFWYSRKHGLVKFNIHAGQAEAEVVFSRRGLQAALDSLRNTDPDDSHKADRHGNVVWWGYEYTTLAPSGYEYAGEVVADPPLVIYRDDFFSVTLPNSVGVALEAIIRQRLAETP